MQKLEFLEDYIASRIKYYRVDQAEYDKIICDIRESLERIRRACETIFFIDMICCQYKKRNCTMDISRFLIVVVMVFI